MIVPDKYKWLRGAIIFFALGSMILVYVFQRRWFWFQDIHAINQFQYLPFVLNRLIRLTLNDSLCLIVFMAIFNSKKEVKLASLIFAIELFVMLPFYFLLKLSLEGDSEISSPLLSFIHRLIVNPLLMMILLMGLLYQRYRTKN